MTLVIVLLIGLLLSLALTFVLCRIAARSDRILERYIPVRGAVRESIAPPPSQEEDFWMFLLRQRRVHDC